MQRGRRIGECWRQLPRCCRINFGGPQTQTVSVDSIERFYRCPFLLSPPRLCVSLAPAAASAHPSRSFAWINSSVFSFSRLSSFRVALTAALSHPGAFVSRLRVVASPFSGKSTKFLYRILSLSLSPHRASNSGRTDDADGVMEVKQ